MKSPKKSVQQIIVGVPTTSNSAPLATAMNWEFPFRMSRTQFCQFFCACLIIIGLVARFFIWDFPPWKKFNTKRFIRMVEPMIPEGIITKEIITPQLILPFLQKLHSVSAKEHMRQSGLSEIYILNLDRRSDRLFKLNVYFHLINANFIRFPAIDGTKIRDYSMIGKQGELDFSRIHPNTSYPVSKIYEIEGPTYPFYGDFGCWQSHLQLYFHIVEKHRATGQDGPILIFEDDVDFEVTLLENIRDAMKQLPDDWDLFLPGHHDMRCINETERKAQLDFEENFLLKHGDRKEPLQSPLTLREKVGVCKTQYFWCAHGYVIRNASVAEKFIKYDNVPYAHSPDYQLVHLADHFWLPLARNGTINAYGILWEPIINQDRKQFTSDIPNSPGMAYHVLDYPVSYLTKQMRSGIYKFNRTSITLESDQLIPVEKH